METESIARVYGAGEMIERKYGIGVVCLDIALDEGFYVKQMAVVQCKITPNDRERWVEGPAGPIGPELARKYAHALLAAADWVEHTETPPIPQIEAEKL